MVFPGFAILLVQMCAKFGEAWGGVVYAAPEVGLMEGTKKGATMFGAPFTFNLYPEGRLFSDNLKGYLYFHFFVQVQVSDVFAQYFRFCFEGNPTTVYLKSFFLQRIGNLNGIN